MSRRARPPVDRLMEKVSVTDSCWRWLGATSPNGYGAFYFEGRQIVAHRASYMIHVGPIPDGLTIDHLCGNRACVNPAHLEPVTQMENVRRWARKITHCPRGHEYTAANTRLTPKGGRQCLLCHRDRERARRARSGASVYSHVMPVEEVPDERLERLLVMPR